MRIGLFSEVYAPYVSGVSTSVSMLKKSLEELGHTVYVVTINIEEHKFSYDEKNHILKIPGIEIGIYENLKFSSIYSIKCTKIIKKWNLDIIHTHTEGSIGTYARILSKQFDIPVVHTYHTMYEDYIYLVTKGHFDKPFKKILEHWTMFYCDKTVSELIVPTKKTYDLFKNKYGIERDVNIIPTGIDIDKFNKSKFNNNDIMSLKEKYNIKSDDFVLLLVSRISEQQKNIKFLLDSERIINKNNKNIKLLVVGDGPDLELFKKQYKNDSGIIFTGMIPQEEVSMYYQLGNVFVTASKTETQGLTVIEALASSLPVVCYDDDSFKLSITEEYNGLFFKTKKEYVKNILELYNNKNKYSIMKKHAINSAGSFNTNVYGQKILEVYERVLRSKDNG